MRNLPFILRNLPAQPSLLRNLSRNLWTEREFNLFHLPLPLVSHDVMTLGFRFYFLFLSLRTGMFRGSFQTCTLKYVYLRSIYYIFRGPETRRWKAVVVVVLF